MPLPPGGSEVEQGEDSTVATFITTPLTLICEYNLLPVQCCCEPILPSHSSGNYSRFHCQCTRTSNPVCLVLRVMSISIPLSLECCHFGRVWKQMHALCKCSVCYVSTCRSQCPVSRPDVITVLLLFLWLLE